MRGRNGVGRSVIVVPFVIAASTSCFNGDAALGLPCESDDDCGLSYQCEAGFCGGAPATSGSTGPDESSSGSDSTSTSDSDGDETVGDGTEDGGSSSGTVPCGNGRIDDGEDCDGSGRDTVDCDADCTFAECGDGYVNIAAFEQCELDEEATYYDECTPVCRQPAFVDRMDDAPASLEKWNRVNPTDPLGQFALPNANQWELVSEQWRSGTYACDGGVTRLEIRDELMLLPPPPGLQWEMRFNHYYRFDPECPEGVGEMPVDGARVVVIQQGMQVPQIVGGLYGDGMVADMLECFAPGLDPYPIVPGPAYVRRSADDVGRMQMVSASLDPWVGEDIRIRPAMAMLYGCTNVCGNCVIGEILDGSQYGWRIDDVVIAEFPVDG